MCGPRELAAPVVFLENTPWSVGQRVGDRAPLVTEVEEGLGRRKGGSLQASPDWCCCLRAFLGLGLTWALNPVSLAEVSLSPGEQPDGAEAQTLGSR